MKPRWTGLICLLLALTSCTGQEDTTNTAEPTQPTPESTSTTSTTTTLPPTTTTSTTTLPPVRSLDSQPIEIGPLEPRGGHSVIWTGNELIVWGGEGDERGRTLFADGAAYDPDSDEWRTLPDAPIAARRYHIAAWTGTEMLVIGGVDESDGAAYRPDTDQWRIISDPPIRVSGLIGVGIEGFIGSTWTGSELIVWHVASDQVAAYDPARDEWRTLPATEIEVDNGALRWDGEAVYAFGATVNDYPASNDLAVFRLGDSGWEALPSVSFSTDNYIIGALAQLTAWAGDRFLAWSDSGNEGTTMAFDPATDTWRQVENVRVAPCEGTGEPISSNTAVFAFGWCGDTVAMLDVESQTWTEAPVGGFPTARYTVWTGDELINWGDTCCYGTAGAPFTVDAWRYEPSG